MVRPAVQVASVNDLLPQTQCTKCGYQGCLPYAQAIAGGQADINRCPPGGELGVAALSRLTGRPFLALDTDCGVHLPLQVAIIDEQYCIGCTLCIQACPVDAILGAPKVMHTVLPDLCTGCDLCVAPCPVDCITMETVSPPRDWTVTDAQAARVRHEARQKRLAAEPATLRRADADQEHVAEASPIAAPPTTPDKQAAIREALARARARRQ